VDPIHETVNLFHKLCFRKIITKTYLKKILFKLKLLPY
jgi:hypothetical protein